MGVVSAAGSVRFAANTADKLGKLPRGASPMNITKQPSLGLYSLPLLPCTLLV